MKIWEPKPPGTLWATTGLSRDTFSLDYAARKIFKWILNTENFPLKHPHLICSCINFLIFIKFFVY